MRYGICTGLENLNLLEQLGYDYIEPSVTGIMSLEQEMLREYREQLKESKIKCEVFNILFPKTMKLVGKEADRSQLNAYLHQAFEVIGGLGAQMVVFGSGQCRRCQKGYEYKRAYQELVWVYRLVGSIGEEYGIRVVIEPLSRKETNLICTMAEGAMLESDVNHPNVALLSDYFHVMANHDHIPDIEIIREFGHIHIASGNGRRYPLSREGEQYELFMKALKKCGYSGRISIEGKTEDMGADGGAALEFLKKLEAEA